MQVWTISDVGISRKNNPNEDTFILEKMEDGCLLAVVCDGMGGANAGEIASGLASKTFMGFLSEKYSGWNENQLKKNMREAVSRANKAVFDASVGESGLSGMGTTIVAAFINEEGEAVLANVGDSRAYLVGEEGLCQLTHDHSLVNEMILRGEISKLEAHRHPSRNLITRAVGVEPEVKCDIYTHKAKKGDFILLCSDGLSDQVSEPEIYYEIYESGHPELACQSLVELANSRGGSDNITMILIAI